MSLAQIKERRSRPCRGKTPAGCVCACVPTSWQVSYEVTVETYIMKRLEYHFTRVTAPAPKRLLIESHSDGSHSISDLCPCPDERLDDEGDASDTANCTTVSG